MSGASAKTLTPLTASHRVSPAVTPSAPGRVLVSRNTKSSVVVQWDRPKQGEDLLGYYVDCCVAGSNTWEPCNHKPIGYNRCCPRGPTSPPGSTVRSAAHVGTARPEHRGRSASQWFAHVESDFLSAPPGRGVLRVVGQCPPPGLKSGLSREKRVPEVRLF